MPLRRVEESYTHSDNLTWTKGAHEMRVGFDVVRHHLNHWQPEIGNFGPRGGLGFSGQETALKGGAAQNQYNAYAAFLLGLSDDSEKSLQNILSTGREWQFGWYCPRPLAGEPEADRQHRSALRVLPVDDARRLWH